MEMNLGCTRQAGCYTLDPLTYCGNSVCSMCSVCGAVCVCVCLWGVVSVRLRMYVVVRCGVCVCVMHGVWCGLWVCVVCAVCSMCSFSSRICSVHTDNESSASKAVCMHGPQLFHQLCYLLCLVPPSGKALDNSFKTFKNGKPWSGGAGGTSL